MKAASFFAALSLSHSKDAFEAAAYKNLTPEKQKLVDTAVIIHEDPFDPKSRTTVKKIIYRNQSLLIVKGALEAILEKCPGINPATRDNAVTWERDHGKNGQRALAVAYKTASKNNHEQINDLTLMGLLAFEDPIKPTTRETIKKAQQLGVTIKILSGDGADVTGAVAHRVGLITSPDQVITGATLAALAEPERLKAIDRHTVFARVTPQQKYDILQQLKTHETIGFLGDGVNDAPALKAADVGIVVCQSTEIARSAADIVLTHKNLGVIVEGIYLGRKTFTNIGKYLKATLCSNIGNFYSIAVASLFINYLPMLPIQILLVDILSDLPMIALATDTVDPEELKKPAKQDIHEIVKAGVFFAIISSFFDLILFMILRGHPALLQTTWYMLTLCEQIGFIFIMRTKKFAFSAVRPTAVLVGLSCLVLASGLIMPYTEFGKTFFFFTHPTGHAIRIIVMIMTTYFVTTELVKIAYYRNKNHAIKKA